MPLACKLVRLHGFVCVGRFRARGVFRVCRVLVRVCRVFRACRVLRGAEGSGVYSKPGGVGAGRGSQNGAPGRTLGYMQRL